MPSHTCPQTGMHVDIIQALCGMHIACLRPNAYMESGTVQPPASEQQRPFLAYPLSLEGVMRCT
jgi:hypothetical protein